VRCFPHLFGFLAAVISIFCTTPWVMASSIINCSTCVDLA
jgi:hypothetical protein